MSNRAVLIGHRKIEIETYILQDYNGEKYEIIGNIVPNSFRNSNALPVIFNKGITGFKIFKSSLVPFIFHKKKNGSCSIFRTLPKEEIKKDKL